MVNSTVTKLCLLNTIDSQKQSGIVPEKLLLLTLNITLSKSSKLTNNELHTLLSMVPDNSLLAKVILCNFG